MIQIIAEGDKDKKVDKTKIFFDNKTTCPRCNCKFQFDYEDLTYQPIGLSTMHVECPWCGSIFGIATTRTYDFNNKEENN